MEGEDLEGERDNQLSRTLKGTAVIQQRKSCFSFRHGET